MSLIKILNFPKFMDIKLKMTIKKKHSMGYYRKENKIKPLGVIKIMFICTCMKMN